MLGNIASPDSKAGKSLVCFSFYLLTCVKTHRGGSNIMIFLCSGVALASPAPDASSLLVLVGLTASRASRRGVARFFQSGSRFHTYVPPLPLRRGVRASARWLERYLAQTVCARESGPIDVLAYIAGGAVLRCLAASVRLPELARVVYVRGPVQELVPAAMVRRYGRLLARVLGGRSMIDLADGWPQRLPFPSASGEQGLIVEEGVSSLARSLRLGTDSVPAAAWEPARLLPVASAVMRVPESHDDVYTSPALLGCALRFFERGRFAA